MKTHRPGVPFFSFSYSLSPRRGAPVEEEFVQQLLDSSNQYVPEDSISRSSRLYDARAKIFWGNKGDQTDRKEEEKGGRKEGRNGRIAGATLSGWMVILHFPHRPISSGLPRIDNCDPARYRHEVNANDPLPRCVYCVPMAAECFPCFRCSIRSWWPENSANMCIPLLRGAYELTCFSREGGGNVSADGLQGIRACYLTRCTANNLIYLRDTRTLLITILVYYFISILLYYYNTRLNYRQTLCSFIFLRVLLCL